MAFGIFAAQCTIALVRILRLSIVAEAGQAEFSCKTSEFTFHSKRYMILRYWSNIGAVTTTNVLQSICACVSSTDYRAF